MIIHLYVGTLTAPFLVLRIDLSFAGFSVVAVSVEPKVLSTIGS